MGGGSGAPRQRPPHAPAQALVEESSKAVGAAGTDGGEGKDGEAQDAGEAGEGGMSVTGAVGWSPADRDGAPSIL